MRRVSDAQTGRSWPQEDRKTIEPRSPPRPGKLSTKASGDQQTTAASWLARNLAPAAGFRSSILRTPPKAAKETVCFCQLPTQTAGVVYFILESALS